MPIRASRREFLAAAAGSAWALALAAHRPAWAVDDPRDFTPRSGQYGKDVIWIPTPDSLVVRMLQLARVGANDTVFDLGSGDGKIVIAAARDHGARAHGIEYDERMVVLARRKAQEAGVAERATFEQADLFASDFSSASVVTMYLMPHLNLRLRHKLLAMKPGTRVVSHEFLMADWEPEESSRIGARSMHLWVVPANAGGDWGVRLPHARGSIDATMRIEQRFQKLQGRVGLGDVDTSLRDARVLGETVHFAFTDAEGALRQVDARIEPDRMIGSIAGNGGEPLPFVAHRIGDTPPIEGSSPMTPDEVRGGS